MTDSKLIKIKRSTTPKTASKAVTNYKANDVERPAGERWITMENALIRAGQGLTLGEKRIVMLAASKLDSYRTLTPSEAPVTRITAKEFVDIFQVDVNTAYEQLQDAAKQLYQRSITFYEPATTQRSKALKPSQSTMRWVGRVHYQKGEGWVDIYWWYELMPYLTGIRQHFTSYQLKQASALRSVYSWRLLELLMRFKSTGTAEYTIDEFCVVMDAPPSLKKDFAQVKRRIIEPAVKELIEKDGWLIQWQPIKAGRKVASIRFTFDANKSAETQEGRDKNTPDMFTGKTDAELRKRRKTITKKQAEEMARPGESYSELYRRLGPDYIITG
jgi:plasmid replication initiation protein